MPRYAFLLAVLLLSGCVARPAVVQPLHPSPELSKVIALAADQVKKCYRAPRFGRDARGIVTILRVAYAPDGRLAELPGLVAQRGVTEDNRHVALSLAEAAAKAVVDCAPLRMPAEWYRNGWDSFELTFSPKAVA